MKVKEVEIGTHKCVIASLTVDQHEQLIGDDLKNMSGKDFIRQHMLPVVAVSLRNALENSAKWFPLPADAAPLDTASISAELDFAEVNELYTEVLKLSGLKAVVAGEGAAATSL